jgi:Phosphatidylinositol-specific phospholipase C, X domain
MWWLALACATDTPKEGAPAACNGLAALCDRPLDEVTFPATHNAMSSAEEGWLAPNQSHALPRQLSDGVRGLNLDVYDVEGVATLCHGYCELGSLPFAEGLGRLRDFLDEAPHEVIVITLESYISAEQAALSFEQAGLSGRVLQHEAGAPWPTLAEMIAADQRVAVWTSAGGEASGWYLDQWSDWVDNPYSYTREDTFLCEPDRGEADNPLYNLNHFVTDPLANIEDAAVANAAEVLAEHAWRCREEQGRQPNQLLVDFYDQGALLEVAAELNEAGPPQ